MAPRTSRTFGAAIAAIVLLTAADRSAAAPFVFNTGNPDGLMAVASQPASAGKFEIEAADDFVLTQATSIAGAQITGLIASNSASSIANVVVEIYGVFPQSSDVVRTSGAPTFSTTLVPTRVNSPSDVAISDRSSSAGSLNFLSTTLQSSFTANNSIMPGGIHPKPGQTTGGEGAVTGQEIQISMSFSTPFNLAAGHYFFVPQVQLTNGDFFWLSAPKPILPPGTAFPPGSTDLQMWTRDEFLAPDWLRVGTDIVGGNPAPQFNGAFVLNGDSLAAAPGPVAGAGLTGLLASFGALLAWYRNRRAAFGAAV